MANNLLLITGANGHIGFRTLVTALEHGYQVRAAIRSESKEYEILSAPSIIALNPGPRLSFIVVPDMTVDDAYDQAIKGAVYIIHLASAIALKSEVKPEDYHDVFIAPAIAGTVNLLKSASKEQGLKRVVITSSLTVVAEAKYAHEIETPEGTVWDHTSRTPFPSGPYPSDFHAYSASKIAALEATDNFVRDNKPHFEVISIKPSMVIGKNELITNAGEYIAGTNMIALGPVLGNKSPMKVVGATVHVDDVALVHVKALDPGVPVRTYIANSDDYAGTVWQNATRVVAEHFPEAVAKGVLPNNGVQETRRFRVNARDTEEIMGVKFKNFEEQVKSVITHYLELKGEKAE
jgi:nucleoside-diphosphate-sugar epimerase